MSAESAVARAERLGWQYRERWAALDVARKLALLDYAILTGRRPDERFGTKATQISAPGLVIPRNKLARRAKAAQS